MRKREKAKIAIDFDRKISNPTLCFQLSKIPKDGETQYILYLPFFFFGLACVKWKFWGQGLNSCHRNNRNQSSDNSRSLICWAIKEFPSYISLMPYLLCVSFHIPSKFLTWLSDNVVSQSAKVAATQTLMLNNAYKCIADLEIKELMWGGEGLASSS